MANWGLLSNWAWALTLPAALALSCTSEQPNALLITHVTPSEVPVETNATVSLGGSGFYSTVAVDLGSTQGGIEVNRRIQVLLDDQPAVEVTVETPQRLRIVTPMLSEAGAYDVTVELADGRRATLPDALRITTPVAEADNEVGADNDVAPNVSAPSSIQTQPSPPDPGEVSGDKGTTTPNDAGAMEPQPEDDPQQDDPALDAGVGSAEAQSQSNPAPELPEALKGPTLPVGLEGINQVGSREDDAFLSADGLELFFASDRNGTFDLWVAERTSIEAPWGTPKRIDELSTDSQTEAQPALAQDGTVMYFAKGSWSNLDIWRSTRPGRGQPWSTAEMVWHLNGLTRDTHPRPDNAELSLVMASDRWFFQFDLFESSRPNTSADWDMPRAISELNTAARESDPFLIGNTLYFRSDRTGNSELYFAERADAGSSFQDPVLLTELNSPASDTNPWVSADHQMVIFTSDRAGDDDLYQAFLR